MNFKSGWSENDEIKNDENIQSAINLIDSALNKIKYLLKANAHIYLFWNPNYIEFIKEKTVLELKKNLKLSIENKLTNFENAFESAKLINLENPIPGLFNLKNKPINETEDLFYYGSKVISQEIIYLKKLLIKLENDQFNFEIISEKPSNFPVEEMFNLKYSVTGIIFGLFLSLLIISCR
jgi:hypothetical protein